MVKKKTSPERRRERESEREGREGGRKFTVKVCE